MSKCLFINAYEFNYLGTRLLASWLRGNGIETHNVLLDEDVRVKIEAPAEEFIGYQFANPDMQEHKAMHAPLTDADWQALEKVIEEEKPDIIGFSARSTNNFLIDPVVKACKKAAPDALLICGGFGPTLEPDLYLEGGFDAAVRGDGEEALLELARLWQDKDWRGMTGIPGTVWSARHGGAANPLVDQTRDLAKYPPPLVGDKYFSWIQAGQLHRHDDPLRKSTTYSTFLGRGCPGKCTYCSGGQWKQLYKDDGARAYVRRGRDSRQVFDELAALPAHVKSIWFVDEFWSMPKDKTREFFEEYKARIHKPFLCYLNYYQMNENPDLFNLAVDAGLDYTAIGFQTGSERLLRECYNRKPRYEELLAYARMVFGNYVQLSSQLIGGNCYETEADFQATLNLARRLPFSVEDPLASYITYFRLRPHPESPIRKSHPRVVSEPMPAWLWHYRALLTQYAAYLEEPEFSSIVDDFGGIASAAERGRLRGLRAGFERAFARRQIAHYRRLMDAEGGKQWVFYGAGDLYAANREFFSALDPLAVVVDKEYKAACAGQRVLDMEELASQYDLRDLRFMVFMPHPLPAQRRLLRGHKVPRSQIHSSSRLIPRILAEAGMEGS